MNALRLLCSVGFSRKILAKIFSPANPALTTEFFHLRFRNAVGLAAGFDKNAKYLRELECLGFGFVEIGTVTPLPQAGNDKPRVFRLPKDKALINRMGFNNEGVKVVAERLKTWKEKQSRLTTKDYRLIIGGNIGKNKITPNEEAWKDYELHPFVDYFVVNVSSPNTPGLRELQEKESLRKILMHLQMINNGKAKAKPLFLKIAPDLTQEQIDDVIDLALEIKLDGLVATNTTISRAGLITPESRITEMGAGGLSGLPVKTRSAEVLKYLRSKLPETPLIGVGGIMEPNDGIKRIALGANLIQVYTGFIYAGPSLIKKLARL